MGIPATGKSIKVAAIIISRFENGLWREDHVCWDQLGMLQQLGVIPMP
jgi:predicted ester cyclase